LFNYNWLESCRDIESLTCQLSNTNRAVLLLHEVEGYSHKEIAKLFDKSESFSKVALSRAYAALRQIVAKQEPIDAFN
jgi:RNA polymerase sigma-70 factor (ECF subfamily)